MALGEDIFTQEIEERLLPMTARRMAAFMSGCCIVRLVIGLCISIFIKPFESPWRYTAGLLLGWLSSLVRVFLMERSFYSMMQMEQGRAKVSFFLNTIARYGITVLSALPVIFFPNIFGPIGFIIGIISLQAGAFLTPKYRTSN
jgi:hypothetical protein